MFFIKKTILIIILLFVSFNQLKAETENTLLFYVGITMAKPMKELAKEFEKLHNCKIKILQGGSLELYQSIKLSKIGDLYLPGSEYYFYEFKNEGLFSNATFVGYNSLALIVKKGNPKNIRNSLDELTNPKLKVVLGDEENGSVGHATKKLLLEYGNYKKAILNTLYLSPDSRNLTQSIKNAKIDLIVNWRATTFWEENKDFIEPLDINSSLIKKSKLMLIELTISKHKELTKKFVDYASSTHGKEIFKKYGF